MPASAFLSFVLAQVYKDSQVPSAGLEEGQSQVSVRFLCCSRFTALIWPLPGLPGKILQENTFAPFLPQTRAEVSATKFMLKESLNIDVRKF